LDICFECGGIETSEDLRLIRDEGYDVEKLKKLRKFVIDCGLKYMIK